ncbi:MAG TPA: exodeoxyribonuclease VII small subunit [Prevotellaceae bacterium]|nr:exodeoxyribonuclease VII small subunit [Prevotellaceae bacterium]HBE55524.1 exodeoxyribonuclease VII small subunit [Prevotellaceae bacterium]
MQEEKLTYEEAMHRLEQLAARMENGEIAIDQMAENLSQAQKWLKQCREQLYEAEKRCDSLLEVNEKE